MRGLFDCQGAQELNAKTNRHKTVRTFGCLHIDEIKAARDNPQTNYQYQNILGLNSTLSSFYLFNIEYIF